VPSKRGKKNQGAVGALTHPKSFINPWGRLAGGSGERKGMGGALPWVGEKYWAPEKKCQKGTGGAGDCFGICGKLKHLGSSSIPGREITQTIIRIRMEGNKWDIPKKPKAENGTKLISGETLSAQEKMVPQTLKLKFHPQERKKSKWVVWKGGGETKEYVQWHKGNVQSTCTGGRILAKGLNILNIVGRIHRFGL